MSGATWRPEPELDYNKAAASLAARVDALEKQMQQGVGQFDQQQLQRALETSWLPSAENFLLDYVPGNGSPAPLYTTTAIFPTSPMANQEFVYVGSTAFGPFVWTFFYDAAAAGWRFKHGEPAIVQVLPQESTTNTSYVDLTTVQQYLVPFAGIWRAQVQARVVSGSAGQEAHFGLKFGAASVDATTDAEFESTAGGGWSTGTGMVARSSGSLPVNTIIKTQARVTGGTGFFANRQLRVWPELCT